MRHVILGTAGHIDHGKSALVKALTGTDPDRLKEEKLRGITIDLGFADLRYEDLTVGIVDVPGHERLVRNMLAGAGGIDIVLLCIAADEGVMPQSREHLAICNLLGIKDGLIVLTKKDLVDEEFLEIVQEEARSFVKGTFLEQAEIIAVSARDGTNIENLKQKIQALAAGIRPKSSAGVFRLPVDRVFTLKGFGTVATGTATSGKVAIDDSVDVLPSGYKGKVRGLHNHNEFVHTGYAGSRLAINLQGVDKDKVVRGDVIVLPDTLHPTQRLDVTIELLKDASEIKNRALLHLHIGTSEEVCRVVLYGVQRLTKGESGYAQLRLSNPVVAMSGDRFIIRRYSPVDTIGGGVVLDPSPPRKTDPATLEILHRASLTEKLTEKVKRSGVNGTTIGALRAWINEDSDKIASTIDALKHKGVLIDLNDAIVHAEVIAALRDDILVFVHQCHKRSPLKAGVTKEELKARFKMIEGRNLFKLIAGVRELDTDKDIVCMRGFKPALTTLDEGIKTKVVGLLKEARFQPPLKDELAKALSMKDKQLDDMLKLLASEGVIVRINDAVYLHKDVFEEMLAVLKAFSQRNKQITVAEFRDLLSTTRKYALPYLEYLDSRKLTMRVGESRKLLM
ncbi:Translation elongation factor, selenocysteine-specific [Candidatus Magnetobacterium bavaricum]|uniref:Selenocysteine-specific elongation factor n=1 Tax=Candidatus Magnetobacterium bavaricum TaxID=29290 RepID=A0A0F3GVH0_9BACT|nr:Translation elongation factor, selenocysteine-specific [Candidatus Magnetobacterium bavaricum]